MLYFSPPTHDLACYNLTPDPTSSLLSPDYSEKRPSPRPVLVAILSFTFTKFIWLAIDGCFSILWAVDIGNPEAWSGSKAGLQKYLVSTFLMSDHTAQAGER
jgi:hypothetical protein